MKKLLVDNVDDHKIEPNDRMMKSQKELTDETLWIDGYNTALDDLKEECVEIDTDRIGEMLDEIDKVLSVTEKEIDLQVPSVKQHEILKARLYISELRKELYGCSEAEKDS